MGDTIFHQFPAGTSQGDIPLGSTGGYHAWISAQYFDGSLEITLNPWTGIVYSGVPHLPDDVEAEILIPAARFVKVEWRPEIFGTWLYQITVFKAETLDPFAGDFIAVDGPSGPDQIWHFIDFGGGAFSELQASFFDGFANFTIPTDGHYVFFIRGVPWLDPFTPGAFAVSPLFTLGAP